MCVNYFIKCIRDNIMPKFKMIKLKPTSKILPDADARQDESTSQQAEPDDTLRSVRRWRQI